MKNSLTLKISRFFNVSQASILISIAVVCMMLPVNILYIRSAYQVQNSLLEQSSETISNIQSVYADDLSSLMSDADTYMIEWLTNNSYLQTVMQQEGDNDYIFNKLFFGQEVISQLYLENMADVFYLYAPEQEDLLFLCLPGNLTDEKSALQEWLKENYAASYNDQWTLISIGNYCYAGHTLYLNGLYLGALIDVTSYISDIQKSTGYSSTEVALLAGYASDSVQMDDAQVQITTDVTDGNFYISSVTLRSEIHNILPLMQRNALIIAVLSLIFIPLLYIVLMFLVVRPLNILGNALTRLQNNPDYRIPGSSQSYMTKEFVSLTDSFNQMADNINELKIENYEQQLARQQVELDNMQLIIRPHFLQNTFSLLYTMCLSGQNNALGRFILFLSDYFRYIYQNVNQLTPFSQELPIVKGYIELAAYQYPDSFDVEYDIEEDLQETMIPPLLILTFVENIMSHARTRGKLLHISIRLHKKTDHTAVFIISDNGRGMPEETVRKINAHETIEEHGRIHVGLRNAFQRLDKIYGGKAGMTVESEMNRGTRITVWLPSAPNEALRNASDTAANRGKAAGNTYAGPNPGPADRPIT